VFWGKGVAVNDDNPHGGVNCYWYFYTKIGLVLSTLAKVPGPKSGPD